jgi:hypothetical protein
VGFVRLLVNPGFALRPLAIEIESESARFKVLGEEKKELDFKLEEVRAQDR